MLALLNCRISSFKLGYKVRVNGSERGYFMRIYDLECLLEVAHNKSISQTAQKLYLGQTTLSAIIRSVEKELGLQIFKRTNAGLVVTPLGEDALSIAEEIVSHAHDFDQLFLKQDHRKRVVHFLAYSAACDFLMVYLSQLLREEDRHIVLSIQPAHSENIIKKLINSEANIGIGGTYKDHFYRQQSLCKENAFITEELFHDQFYIFVSSQSPLAAKKTIALAELSREHIASTNHFPFRNSKPASPLCNELDQYTVFPTIESIKKAIVQNQMVGILPGLAFYQDIYQETGLIKQLTIEGVSTELINYMVYPQKTTLIKEELFLLDAIRMFYNNLQKNE